VGLLDDQRLPGLVPVEVRERGLDAVSRNRGDEHSLPTVIGRLDALVVDLPRRGLLGHTLLLGGSDSLPSGCVACRAATVLRRVRCVARLAEFTGPVAERVEVPLRDDLVEEAHLVGGVLRDLLPDECLRSGPVAGGAPANLGRTSALGP